MTQQIIASTHKQSFDIQSIMMRGMMMSITIPEAIPQ